METFNIDGDIQIFTDVNMEGEDSKTERKAT